MIAGTVFVRDHAGSVSLLCVFVNRSRVNVTGLGPLFLSLRWPEVLAILKRLQGQYVIALWRNSCNFVVRSALDVSICESDGSAGF